MGRRSINTTKSGKYMNPTDQARKEARKKELKKNKKQRQLVRAAVLKGKDPTQIIEEMEKIDQMEYNVMQPPPLNEKVLKDKRKKLKETLDRVLKMYAKDDHEKWTELKEQLIQYERRRIDLVSYFEAVKHAQQVQVDEIPLPSTNSDISRMYSGAITAQIPLPDVPQPPLHIYPPHPHYIPHHPLMNIPIPPSILKKTSAYSAGSTVLTLAPSKKPPGVPPYPPPDILSEDEDLSEKSRDSMQKSRTIRFADDKNENKLESDKDNYSEKEKDREIEKVKPTTLQQKMLAMAGQDIDQFMREMEVVHKKRETERAQDLNARLSLLENESEGKSTNQSSNKRENEVSESSTLPTENVNSSAQSSHISSMHLQQQPQQHGLPPVGIPPPPPLLYRPPPPPMHLRMPPPPPPPRVGLRLPPGPPPGMPRMLRPGPPNIPRIPPPPQMQVGNLPGLSNLSNSQMQNTGGINIGQAKQPNVLSAAPQLINRKDKDGKSSTTIEAKPQIRNLTADVTRFLPTSLRVKREDKKKPANPPVMRLPERISDEHRSRPAQPKTKDDAYMQFMQEMEGLL